MKLAIRILVTVILLTAGWVAIQHRRTADLNNRAVQLLNEGKYQEALPLLEKARSRTPGNAMVLQNLARTYDNLGRDQEALEAYRVLLAKRPGDEDAKRRAEELEDDNRVRERAAERVARMKAENFEDNDMALDLILKLADAYFHVGHFDLSRQYYQHVLFRDPTNLLAERRIEVIENKEKEDSSKTEGEEKQ